MNIEKLIEYWINASANDVNTAELLINNDKYLNGLFFCHLVIEKAIKAHVVKNTQQMLPKSHNLFFLFEKANLKIEEKDKYFLGILMKYQLEGRYPDYDPFIPSKTTVTEYLIKTKEIFQWLKEQL
ncbi:MAG: HEPN domain-containing protein [Candidatus Cloacimonetes bacterium]|nr:HEPN domain-containing protein [Candidatus Cloacimonadota bacterium]